MKWVLSPFSSLGACPRPDGTVRERVKADGVMDGQKNENETMVMTRA